MGTGIISTAIKADLVAPDVVAAAVASMSTTNADATRVALDAGATGATDVTGFGILGHLRGMAEASQVDVTVDVAAVPALPGATELAGRDIVPGGTRRNLEWIRDRLDVEDVDDTTVVVLADAQTSGGLLFGAEPSRAERAVAGRTAAVIGQARTRTGRLHLR